MRRVGIVLLLVLVTAVATAFAVAPSVAPHETYYRLSVPLDFSGAQVCGIERWTVKTLQDRPKLLRLQRTTVAHLISLPRPASLPATRLPFERHVFRVTAAVTLVRQEADQDLHLVLQVGPAHMIAEAPNAPICTPKATAYRKRQMASARKAVKLCASAVMTGVAFWDFKHGQTGVAPNAIELHTDSRLQLPRRAHGLTLFKRCERLARPVPVRPARTAVGAADLALVNMLAA